MSTIDPLERDRDPGVAARRRLVWTALMLAVALAGGYGFSLVADFPGSSVGFGAEEPWALVKTGLLLGSLLGTIPLMAVVIRLPQRPGVAGEQAFTIGLTTLAGTAGIFVGSLLPTSFREYADTDLSGKRSDIRFFCALLLVVVAVFFLWAVFKNRGRRRVARLRSEGRQVEAEVTEVHDTGVTNNNAPWVRLTVRFTDSTGTTRYVRRHLSVSRFSRPSAGDTVQLWYDPADPADEKKIVLGA